jgi:hypothetical protein
MYDMKPGRAQQRRAGGAAGSLRALSGAAPKLIEHLAEQEEGAPDRFADNGE